jgi:hypothetical protein
MGGGGGGQLLVHCRWPVASQLHEVEHPLPLDAVPQPELGVQTAPWTHPVGGGVVVLVHSVWHSKTPAASQVQLNAQLAVPPAFAVAQPVPG